MQIQISHSYLLFTAAGALQATKATSGAKAILKCAHIHMYTNWQSDYCAKYRKKKKKAVSHLLFSQGLVAEAEQRSGNV